MIRLIFSLQRANRGLSFCSKETRSRCFFPSLRSKPGSQTLCTAFYMSPSSVVMATEWMLLGGGGTMSGLESIGSRIPSFFFRPYLHFYLSDLAQILGISRSEGPLEEYIGFLVRVAKCSSCNARASTLVI